MKKVLLVMILISSIFLLAGCANDASDEEKEKILKALQEENYLPSDLKYVERTHLQPQNTTQLNYTYVEVYESDGKYYSINFDKIYIHNDSEPKECDFIAYVYDDVEVLKNKSTMDCEIDKETKKNNCKSVVKDLYDTNEKSVKKYCLDKKTKRRMFSKKTYFEVKELD